MAQKINATQVEGVAFKARRNTNLSSGNGATINLIFDLEYYDIGYGDSNYDESTGLFTAPVDGIYHFTASAYTETTTTVRAFFQPRTTNAPTLPTERGLDANFTATKRAVGSWEVYLNAGETFGLTIYTTAVNQLNHQDTWFAGHLVTAV